MNKDNELNKAVDEIFLTIDESEEFKRRLKRLIANAMEDSYLDDDILAVINLMEKEK